MLGAKVDHKERHAVLLALDAAVVVEAARLLGDHVQVGPRHIGIGDDGVGLVYGAIGHAHACRLAPLHQDLVHFGVGVNGDAQFGEQPLVGVDDGAGAAVGIVNAPLTLEVVDQHIKRRGIERIAADEQRVERETAAQKFIFDEFGHVAVDAAIALQADQIRRDLEHVRHMQEGFVDERHARLEDLFGGFDEAGIAFFVGRVPLVDLAEDEFVIAVVVETATVVIEDAVEGINGHELEVVFALAACQFPDFVEEPGGGDHRRATVEGEAVHFVGVGASSQLVALFEYGYFVTSGGHARGDTQSTKPRTNDNNV